MGQPYEYNTRQYEYYYDNDDNDYLLDEDIDYAILACWHLTVGKKKVFVTWTGILPNGRIKIW